MEYPGEPTLRERDAELQPVANLARCERPVAPHEVRDPARDTVRLCDVEACAAEGQQEPDRICTPQNRVEVANLGGRVRVRPPDC